MPGCFAHHTLLKVFDNKDVDLRKINADTGFINLGGLYSRFISCQSPVGYIDNGFIQGSYSHNQGSKWKSDYNGRTYR
jgi:hypothetical protein